MGTAELRRAMRDYVVRSCGVTADFGVIPSIGSKELVGGLPALLGIGAGQTVVIPSVCYPTYEVGVLLAGATVVRADTPREAESAGWGPPASLRPAPALVWLNSPGNPNGRVMPPEQLREWVAWARSCGAVIASDECYLSLPWEETPVSILDPSINDGSIEGLLAVHSLSKRSNLAGYRAGLVAGDPALVTELLAVRKHAGLMVPAPVQAAMVAALDDDAHVKRQRERYAARRAALHPALIAAGFTIEHSTAGLYLWATRGEECWQTVSSLAELGILASPGAFYGPDGATYVRFALTATDERIATAVSRLRA